MASDIVEQATANFVDIIATSEHTSIFTPKILSSFEESLRLNNLFKISIKGSSSTFRLNDNHIIGFTESLIKSNIRLAELSLTYHQITGLFVFDKKSVFVSHQRNMLKQMSVWKKSLDCCSWDSTAML